MANDIYNYSVMTNTGKGFIKNEDSRAFWISGQPANVWIATDCRESRHWVARNNGVSKTKDQAQTLVTAAVKVTQDAWDDDNVEGESSDDKIARIGGKPGNVWVCDDIPESRDWGARNSAASKTKSQAQTVVTNIIDDAKDAWDADNEEGESAAEKILRIGNKPTTITLP